MASSRVREFEASVESVVVAEPGAVVESDAGEAMQ